MSKGMIFMNVTDFVDTNILVYAYDLESLGLVPLSNLLTLLEELIMNLIKTQDQIEKLKEDSLCTEVLVPLFIAMGFRDVRYYHGGSQELGKDIIMWKEGAVGNRENYAVVVKAHRITGKTASGKGSVAEVRTQIEQCFGNPYKDPVNGSDQSVNICWVVSSHEIKKEAITALCAALKSQRLDMLVTFIDGNKLWELIEKYLIQETL
jgi:hypothetical protein